MPKRNSRIEIKERLSASVTIITGLAVMLGYMLYDKDKQIAYLGQASFWSIVFLGLCFLLYNLYKAIKRETIMAIDERGVFHKVYGQMLWDDILSVRKTRKRSGEDEPIYFRFQTTRSSMPYEICISNLDIGEGELIKVIRRHRGYNIFEVPYEEW